MELTINIRNVLLTMLKNRIIVTSWGVSNINICRDRLYFDVNGLKFSGNIEISTNNLNKYNIKIGGKTYICELNDVVSIIDKEVEYIENYQLKAINT